jgi:hypothetical protein
MVAVAVALRPAEYDFGAEPPDGSAWELFGERYETNPKLLLGDSERAMLSIWSLYRQGHLPEAGGIMCQAAVMVEALQAMDAAAAKITERRR